MAALEFAENKKSNPTETTHLYVQWQSTAIASPFIFSQCFVGYPCIKDDNRRCSMIVFTRAETIIPITCISIVKSVIDNR